MKKAEISIRKKIVQFILVVCCCISTQVASGQLQSQFKLLAKVDITVKFLTVDNLDNIYLVTHQNELLKYNSTGKFLYRYSNKSFGNDFQIDVNDPLRVLIFYPLFQQIIILNNTLSEISSYSFSNDVSKQIKLVVASGDNGIWVYDQNNQELQKLSKDFTDEHAAGNIYQQTGINIQPEILKASSQFLYLYDEKTGIVQFDRFGSYIKTIVTEPISNFQVNNDEIIYLKDDSIKKLNQQTYQLHTELLPIKNIREMSVGNKIMSLSAENAVYIYALE